MVSIGADPKVPLELILNLGLNFGACVTEGRPRAIISEKVRSESSSTEGSVSSVTSSPISSHESLLSLP